MAQPGNTEPGNTEPGNTRAFHVEIPIIFLVPVEAATIEEAQRIVGRWGIDDAIERHRWYVVSSPVIVEGALPSLPELDDDDDDAAEGGESH